MLKIVTLQPKFNKLYKINIMDKIQNMDKENQSLNETLQSIDQETQQVLAKYKRSFNKPIPNFLNNKDDDPATIVTFCIGFLCVIPIYCFFTGIMVLLNYWGLNEHFSLGYVSIGLIILYVIIFPIISIF